MESQETKIRRGQAYNLAVHDAVHHGEENNPKYIFQKFTYYYSLGDAIQGGNVEMLLEVIDNKDFSDIVKKLTTTLNTKKEVLK